MTKDYAILGAFSSATNSFGTGQKAKSAHSLQPESEGGVLITHCSTNIIIFTERQVHESALFLFSPQICMP